MTIVQPVEVTVVEVEHVCPLHKEGDRYQIAQTTPAGLCTRACLSLMPLAAILLLGTEIPSDQCATNGLVGCEGCGTPMGRAIFKLDTAGASA